MSRENFDVIVIGGGVLGAFHAYFSAKRGWKTLLIERGTLPGGASVRNFGMVIPSGMPPGEWQQRGLAGIDIYRQVASEIGLPLNEAGTLYVAQTPAEQAVIEEFARIAPERGYSCHLLDADQTRELNPRLRAEYCRAGMHFPNELRIESPTLFEKLIPWMVNQLGCHYLPRTVATGIDTDANGCSVTTAAGNRYQGRHVFLCSGSDLRSLLPTLFAESGLEYCKLQMMRVSPPNNYRLPIGTLSGLSIRRYPSFRICSSARRFQEEPADAELNDRGIHVLVAQDADGSLIVGDSHHYSSEPPNDTLDERTDALILDYAREMFDLADWRVTSRWHGVYTQHPEAELFSTTLSERIHVITGIGGKGMTTGPALARESIERIERTLA